MNYFTEDILGISGVWFRKKSLICVFNGLFQYSYPLQESNILAEKSYDMNGEHTEKILELRSLSLFS